MFDDGLRVKYSTTVLPITANREGKVGLYVQYLHRDYRQKKIFGNVVSTI